MLKKKDRNRTEGADFEENEERNEVTSFAEDKERIHMALAIGISIVAGVLILTNITSVLRQSGTDISRVITDQFVSESEAEMAAKGFEVVSSLSKFFEGRTEAEVIVLERISDVSLLVQMYDEKCIIITENDTGLNAGDNGIITINGKGLADGTSPTRGEIGLTINGISITEVKEGE